MPFYTFNQNNSGGHFTFDAERGISEYVIVEGRDIPDATHRAEDIGIYFDGCASGMDCSCCGDRWSSPWGDEMDPEPMIYGKPAKEHGSSWMVERPAIFIHWLGKPFEAVTPSRDA